MTSSPSLITWPVTFSHLVWSLTMHGMPGQAIGNFQATQDQEDQSKNLDNKKSKVG